MKKLIVVWIVFMFSATFYAQPVTEAKAKTKAKTEKAVADKKAKAQAVKAEKMAANLGQFKRVFPHSPGLGSPLQRHWQAHEP